MTMTAHQPITEAGPGSAPEILREMAAVIRAVFGVGIQSSREAAATAAAEPEAPQLHVVAVPTEPPAATTPASIPMPTSIPLPDLPAEPVTQAPAVAATTGEVSAPYDGEVPALRIVVEPPTDDVPAEQSHALLREVAFLDE